MRKFILISLSMFVMSYEVLIGQNRLNAIGAIEIEQSQSFLADQCSIKLPSQVRGRAYQIEGKIKRGDRVEVRLGYDKQLKAEFRGYVKALRPNSPFEIECEDAFYLTRKPIANKILKNVTVPDIANYVLGEINKQNLSDNQLVLKSDISGFEFSKFSIHQVNGFEVLDKLRQETGLAIFMVGNTLHIYPQYKYKPTGGDVTYNTSRNVRDTSNLEYVRVEDKQILVKVVGVDAKGKKIKATAGEKGGDMRTIHRPTVSTPETLKNIAEQTRKAMTYTGYRGAIQGWLLPYCETGYTAKIIDPDYPEREGRYYVSGVQTVFSGSQGGVRTVQLGIKI